MGRRLLAIGGLIASLATGSVAAAPAAPAAEGRGPSVCPAERFMVGEGWGADRGRRIHTGIDLGGRRGSRIFAVENGVVNRTKLQSNGALQIVMRGRSGSMYYYGHMDKVLIKGGQRVRAGDVIGLMGDTGSPGQVHLHFEYWKSGRESDAIDAEPLVNRLCGVRDGKGGDRPGQAVQDVPPADPAAPTVDPAAHPSSGQPEPEKGDPSIIGEVFTNG